MCVTSQGRKADAEEIAERISFNTEFASKLYDTVAPGTTAPFGSVTVPVSVARVVWPNTGCARHRPAMVANTPARVRRMILLDSMWHPFPALAAQANGNDVRKPNARV